MDLFTFIKDKFMYFMLLCIKKDNGYLTSVAKWIRRPASNRKIVGSTPTRGSVVCFICFCIYVFVFFVLRPCSAGV